MPGLPDDPRALRELIRSTKVISSWRVHDTANFMILADEDVDARLAAACGEAAEDVRSRLLQPRFPVEGADLLILRICKDATQYRMYGGPPGTAGYVDGDCTEVVLHQDDAEKQATLRTLQQLLCSVHLRAALGPDAGHAWFRAGFEGWTAAHSRIEGRLTFDPQAPTLVVATSVRRGPGRPRLADLLAWDGRRGAAGTSLAGLDEEQVRALAADFVAFLVDSVPAVAAIPRTYFAALVRGAAADTALEEALRGTDVERLERAWRAH